MGSSLTSPVRGIVHPARRRYKDFAGAMNTSKQERRDLYEAFEAALEAERAIFQMLQGRDRTAIEPDLMKCLIEAVNNTNAASNALRESLKVQRDF